MQLIFVTLFLLFILLPGIAARLGYLRRDGLITVTGSKFYIEFIFIVFISLFFHFVCWFYLDENSSYEFNIDLFYKLVIGKDITLNDYKESIFLFTTYNTVLSLSLFVLGLISNTILTHLYWRFNLNFSFLEYTGVWDRILSIDICKENKKELRSGKKSLVLKVAVLTLIGDKPILYGGKLHEYHIDNKGYIDKVVLLEARRLELQIQSIQNKQDNTENDFEQISETDNDEITKLVGDLVDKQNTISPESDPRYTKIENHHFVIYGSTIQNISINFELIPNTKKPFSKIIKIKNAFTKIKDAFMSYIDKIKKKISTNSKRRNS